MSLATHALATAPLASQGVPPEINLHSFSIQQTIDASDYGFRFFIRNTVIDELAFSVNIEQEVIGEENQFLVSITNTIQHEQDYSFSITSEIIEVLVDGVIDNSLPDTDYVPADEVVGTPPDPATVYPNRGYVSTSFSPGDQDVVWTAEVDIGGIDVSYVLIGDIIVNKEASQASVATFTILDTNLNDAAVNSWNQKTVTVRFLSGTHRSTMFVGSISGFSFDAQQGTFSFTATNDLQQVIREKYNNDSLSAPGGAAFAYAETTPGADGWLWFQDAMSTVPYDFGLSNSGGLVFYAWESGSSNITLSENDIITDTLSVQLQDSKALINYIEVGLVESSKSLGAVAEARFFQDNLNTYKTIVHSQESLDSYGLKREVVSQSVAADYANSLELWTTKIDEIVAEGDVELTRYLKGGEMADLVLGASSTEVVLSPPYTCPASGVTGQSDDYAVQVRNFYNSLGVKPSITSYLDTTIPVEDPCEVAKVTNPEEPVVNSGDISLIDADGLALCNNHEEAQLILARLVSQAKKRILETHRQTTVTCTIPIRPSLTWGNSCRVHTANLDAKGRVHSVTHSLSIDSGQAVTSITTKCLDAGKSVAGNNVNVVILDDLPATDLVCTGDGGFDNIVFSQSQNVTFLKVLVPIPNTNVSLGKY